jgi:hypothetical protein
MAEPERTTSFAKSVEGLHKEESALDRARSLRDQFTHAQEQNNEKQKPREAEKPQGETEKSGSAMVKDDAPVLRPTPNGPMRQMADRQASAANVVEGAHGLRAKTSASPADARRVQGATAAVPRSRQRPRALDTCHHLAVGQILQGLAACRKSTVTGLAVQRQRLRSILYRCIHDSGLAARRGIAPPASLLVKIAVECISTLFDVVLLSGFALFWAAPGWSFSNFVGSKSRCSNS